MENNFKNQISEYLELEGRQLYWDRRFSKADIFIRTFGSFIKTIIRIGLFIIAGLGILSLLNHLWLVQQSGLSLISADAWLGKYYNYFLWSMLTNLYLFYSFGLDNNRTFIVLKKKFSKNKAVSTRGGSALGKKEKSKRIDISDSFGKDVLKVIDTAYLRSLNQNKVLDHLHLFYQLLNQKQSRIIFGRLGVSLKSLLKPTKNLLNQSENITEKNVNPEILKTFLQAYYFAYTEGRLKVELSDLLNAVVSQNQILQDLLLEFEITSEKITNVIKWVNINKILLSRYKRFRAKATYKPKGVMDRAMTALATPVLDSFSEDLTALARSGYLPLCVARDKEFEEIFNIVEGGRNSVVLVGLSGVGKTNIIEGLANRMTAEEVPKVLEDKRLVSLSIPNLVAGASQPGILEERLMIITKEIIRARNVILHIDDVHNLVGVTSVGSENVELSEMFAETLQNKGIITIATTTPSDYTQYLEGHPLGEKLQKVIIEEPDDNRAIQMLEAKVGYIEGKNQIGFSYDALERAVKLTRRFMPDHYLPDKAIRILEEVAVKVFQDKGKNSLVSGENVAEIISCKTKIPLTQISQDETEKLLNLEERIHQRMVNQEEAVNLVASSLRRARAELRDTKRPIVNLLFLGPTGVGKTELAKTVAQIYFGSEDNMIRIDMSEYQLKENVNRLIGSRNSESKGILTEAVRKNPFSLILLDEIEKAHPDILNLFLQVMDDGRLTDATGKTVDFSNSIIIATSNAGTQFLQDSLREGKTLDEIKNQLMLTELKQYFRPEFLNRFDGIVIFKPLTQEHIKEITYLMLNKVKKRLDNKGIYLEVTEPAVEELAKLGFDPTFGARPLRRVIQEKVDNALADYLLTGKIGRRDKVIFEEGGVLRVEKAKKF